MRLISFLLWLIAATLVSPASAHEVRPAYLELRQTAPDTYSLLFKVPALGDQYRLGISVVMPEGTDDVAPPRAAFLDNTHIQWRTLRHKGGLVGQQISIDGLSATLTSVLVRVEDLAGTVQTLQLTPTKTSFAVEAAPGAGEVFITYVRLGVEHILLGIDHLLFVLGLVLLVKNRWMLVKTITAFTVAHSITLALATLGYASIPVPPLNAAIALSILFLGPEIVRSWHGGSSLTIRSPWIVAFAFGLLHGFGFASGLAQMGLPQTEIPMALLSFNVGVEFGQLGFVALVLFLERSFRVLEIAWPAPIAAIPAYAVGSLGVFWTIDRVVAISIGGGA